MSTALSLLALMAVGGPSLQSLLDEIRIEQEVPGISVAVACHGEIIFASGSGVADIEKNIEMTADTQLYAGSLSKIFTTILALQLVEQGQLALDETIADIAVESTKLGEGIRIAHLLTHASGLEREGDFGYWFSGEFPDASALASFLHNTELREPPGTSIHYSNLGYAHLGALIARANESSYFDALQSQLLDPLGMMSSGAPGPTADIGIGYTPPNRIIPSEERPFAGVGRRIGSRHVCEYHDAKAMTPAFGIFTSAKDLSLLAQFILGHEGDNVLSHQMRAQMLHRQPSGWGLGIKLGRLNGRPIAQHSGWFAAHPSHLMLGIESGISVAVIANSDNAAPNKVAEAFMQKSLELVSLESQN